MRRTKFVEQFLHNSLTCEKYFTCIKKKKKPPLLFCTDEEGKIEAWCIFCAANRFFFLPERLQKKEKIDLIAFLLFDLGGKIVYYIQNLVQFLFVIASSRKMK